MDLRAEKIAKARLKLKNHQERKITDIQKENFQMKPSALVLEIQNGSVPVISDGMTGVIQDQVEIKEKESPIDTSSSETKQGVNVTEILISTKTNLEAQIKHLTEKLVQLEHLYRSEMSNHDFAKKKIDALEHELNIVSNKYETAIQDITQRDGSLSELHKIITAIKDENNNLSEQLELTKSILTSKEAENTQLHHNLSCCQNQLDVLQLQIQQLTNNAPAHTDQTHRTSDDTEAYLRKISNLERTIEALKKERDQINIHYEHYVRDLNQQYKSELKKTENLAQEIQNLYNRENSLIEQISELEIRLQNYKIMKEERTQTQETNADIEKKYDETKEQLRELNAKYEQLQKQHTDSLAEIDELRQIKEIECRHDNISIDKLTADIASDKIAAQRATEQNKKLKSDVENLEQIIVKLGKDKLELTEMWTHEKQLNKGLALKLADVEENVGNTLKLVKAKDVEMIRLQNENRELEKMYHNIRNQMNQYQNEDTEGNHNHNDNSCHEHNHDHDHEHNHHHDHEHNHHHDHEHNHNHDHEHNHHNHDDMPKVTTEVTSLVEIKNPPTKLDVQSSNTIPKQDAMTKLQERFLNIMDQVANLSDEKHRLEHIILQLQNETDTICEYVALYQQQRSLLKRREEERSNQLKIYQTECNKLKQHLEELRDLLLKVAGDHEMESYFKKDQRRNDLTRVKELLDELQNCSLINPRFKSLDLNNFYPCGCCSGQIIEI